jgi:hypothetical protein
MTQAYTNRFTEVHELPANAWRFSPGTYAQGVYSFDVWANMANRQRATFILGFGIPDVGATMDVVLWQAKDENGTDAKPITGKALTQLSEAAGDINDWAVIELRTEELDVNNRYTHISPYVTIEGAACGMCALLLLGASNWSAVPVNNWTEIVD